jgi:hypothetical protein
LTYLLGLQVYGECADAAAALVSFWKQPAHVKLLLRPLPVTVTGQQVHYIAQCNDLISDLVDAVLKAGRIHKQLQKEGRMELSEQLLLESTFAAQPVATLARLLVWMQKGADLLALPSLDAQLASAAASSSSSSSSLEAHLQPCTALWQTSAKGGSATACIKSSCVCNTSDDRAGHVSKHGSTA